MPRISPTCWIQLPKHVVQWAHLAGDKGLATVERLVAKEFVYTDEGKAYRNERPSRNTTLPLYPAREQRFPISRSTRRSGSGLASCERKGWSQVDGTSVTKTPGASTDADEASLKNPSHDDPRTKELIKRGILQESETVRYMITITHRRACTRPKRS